MKMDEKYTVASSILEDVRLGIDFDNMNKSRLRGIREEFQNKVKAFSKCYSGINQFLEKLCKSFGSKLSKEETLRLIETCNNYEIMQVYRQESQIPVLILQLKRDEEKKKWLKKKDDDQKFVENMKEIQQNLFK